MNSIVEELIYTLAYLSLKDNSIVLLFYLIHLGIYK